MSLDKPLVSIVLTLFNKREYIEEQIFSIYKQTYTNWELIIIDDCSTDDSFEFTKDFCFRLGIADKCTFVQNDKNLWLAKTFEKWLTFVKWVYVAVCDADDIWMKNKLEVNLSYSIKNNLDLCYSDLVEIDENNNLLAISNFAKLRRSGNNYTDNSLKNLLRSNHITAPSILFSASILPQLLLIWFPEKTYQDYWIVLFCISSGLKIGMIPTPLVYYRKSSSSMSMTDIVPLDKNYFIKKRDEKIYIIQHLLKISKLSSKNKQCLTYELYCNQILSSFLKNEISFFSSLKQLITLRKIPWIYILLKYQRLKYK